MSQPGSLEPSLLRTFVCIAESGTFTRAAEMVGRSQSAVSMQMRRLEGLLGQTLLARSKGGTVRLTGHGSQLLARAKEMLALNDSIWADFHGQDSNGQERPDDYSLPLKAQREAFTTQVMLTLLTNEKFTEAYAMAMRCVETNTPCDPAKLLPREDELYMALLSMLEYISINFLSNTMDRAIILRQRRSGLLRVHQALTDYIDHKRVVWKRPNAYRSFEIVVRDHILKAT
jgi:molybdenum-dependent DNA-binding transcriptional regulator ModE